MGWGQLKNGALLSEAESNFDVFITKDQNLKYQQNISGRNLAILVLHTNVWPTIRSKAVEISAGIDLWSREDFLI